MKNKKFIKTGLYIIVFLSIAIIACSGCSNQADKINNRGAGLEEGEILGNTTGNISNFGIAAKSGEWVFYSNYSDGRKLYKEKADGSERQKVSDDSVRNINVVGEWIFYSNASDEEKLYKIKTDGSGRIKICDDRINFLNTDGNWLYYAVWVKDSSKDKGEIFKINLNGAERTKLNNDWSEGVVLYEGWLFYNNLSDYSRLYKVKTDGTERTKLSDETPSCMNIEDGWIYYNLGDTLCKMRVDGMDKATLVKDYACFLNKKGEWIYYCKGGIAGDAAHGPIYKIKTDGTKKSKVLDDEHARNFSIIGEWIYYTRFKTSGGSIVEPERLYKAGIDGTGRQLVQ